MSRWMLIILLTVSAILPAGAQDLYQKLDDLVTKGNRAYELGRRKDVLEYADSIGQIIRNHYIQWDAMPDYTVEQYKLYGDYYFLKGEYGSALWYYGYAKDEMDKRPDTSFKNNRMVMRRELAQAYYRIGEYEKAEELLSEVDDMLEDGIYLEGDDEWLIIKLTYALTKARLHKTEEALEMAKGALNVARNKKSEAYAKSQRMFGKIQLLADADKKGALKAYKDYFKSQKQYALDNLLTMNASQRSDYWQMVYPFIADCYYLEEADPAFLYDVALFSKGLLLQLSSGPAERMKEYVQSLQYTHDDIKKKLKKGEAAMEIIEYDKDGSRRLAALLLTKDGKVRFYRLPTEEEMMNVAGENFITKGIYGKDELCTNKELQSMMWPADLLQGLKGIDKIYFSPDGYVQKLGVEYMPQVENKKLYRLTSTRNLMQQKKKFDAKVPMLLVGKINFDYDNQPGSTLINDTEAYNRLLGSYFGNLNAQTDEAQPIYEMRDNPADTLLTFANASEYSFRQLAPRYGMILVATHGSFEGYNPTYAEFDEINPEFGLSNNIVAFSGVNSYLDEGVANTTRGDGILSAKEISQMDLTGCRLFVASACQTGLGQVTPDGVFGFQRGLKMAGVDAMLVSLWSVNSAATYMLMNLMYANLMDGMDLHQAFNEARESMKRGEVNNSIEQGDPERVFNAAIMAGRVKAPDMPMDYSLPQFTDAFILVDGN